MTISIRQDSTTTKHNINQSRGIHPQTRQGRRWVKRWVGLAPPLEQLALPFLWATVLLKFARNWSSQCAKTCDCHSAPWPMGRMNGTVTTRLVGEQRERGVAPFFLSTQGKCVCRVTHRYTLDTFVITCTQLPQMKTQND